MSSEHDWTPVVESEQLVLEMQPLVTPPRVEGECIQEKFESFHALNPWVYKAFCQITDDWLARGRGRMGIGMLTEILRWQYGRQTSGDDFKINNNFRSRYVRLMVAEHPEYAEVFQTRELRGGMTSLPTLWHYTCDHSRAELGDHGTLLPTADRADVSSLGINAWPTFFVWVTDLAEPDRHALGLTMEHIRCDRTAHRYRVTDDSDIVAWHQVIDADPGYASVAQLLESPGADPSHWFVARGPVPVTYDPLPLFAQSLFLPDPYERDLAAVSALVAERWRP